MSKWARPIKCSYAWIKPHIKPHITVNSEPWNKQNKILQPGKPEWWGMKNRPQIMPRNQNNLSSQQQHWKQKTEQCLQRTKWKLFSTWNSIPLKSKVSREESLSQKSFQNLIFHVPFLRKLLLGCVPCGNKNKEIRTRKKMGWESGITRQEKGKRNSQGTSLVVWWLKLFPPKAGSPGIDPRSGN